MEKQEKIVGCLELVGFPELDIFDVLAKVDTGAFSGAIHCNSIHVVKRGVNKTRILKFSTPGLSGKAFETEKFEETHIRSSTGNRVKRFIIQTKMVIAGEEYPVKIGLSDRRDMKRAVLIGRRILRENSILVDVRKNSELDDEGENTR